MTLTEQLSTFTPVDATYRANQANKPERFTVEYDAIYLPFAWFVFDARRNRYANCFETKCQAVCFANECNRNGGNPTMKVRQLSDDHNQQQTAPTTKLHTT